VKKSVIRMISRMIFAHNKSHQHENSRYWTKASFMSNGLYIIKSKKINMEYFVSPS
jgi:hypothetical protein